MRTLGIDLGDKRIGLALSDGLGITAQGLETVRRGDADALRNIINENEVSRIVVGLPLNMDGTEGEQAKGALAFAEELRSLFSIVVDMWDERLSTISGERDMIRGGLSRGKRKKLKDKVAAQLILQNYLDANKNKS